MDIYDALDLLVDRHKMAMKDIDTLLADRHRMAMKDIDTSKPLDPAGHKSLVALRQYERTTEAQFKAVGESISHMEQFSTACCNREACY